MLAHFPPQPTAFIGRTKELADVDTRLANPECRLLTITGAGGSGKTRLAIEAAITSAGSFSNGAVFVGLQPLGKSDQLAPAIALSLGLSFYGTAEPQNQLLSYLREKSLLLLLDNFEHLLDGSELVSAIVAQSPSVKVLVTSREPLNLQEEWLYPLSGLDTPPSVYSTPEDYEAVQLFLYHARRVQPKFDQTSESEGVVQICRVAEGLPLAIELAASWLKGMSAAQIAAEMKHNLDFLTTRSSNVEARHRSIYAAFDQSWKLLSEIERRTFARLSVFRGGFDRKAAQQVTGLNLPTLVALVEKSLLQKQPSDRYEIHELLRQFGESKLRDSEDYGRAHELHKQYFCNLVRELEADIKGRRQIESLGEFDLNFDNIRVAWDWALQTGDYDALHVMMEGLLWYGVFRSRQHSVNALYESVLQQVSGDGAEYLKARITARQCHLLPNEVTPSVVVEKLEKSLAVLKPSGNEAEGAISSVLLALFLSSTEQRNFERALELAQHARMYFEQVGDRFYLAHSLHAISFYHYYQGDRVHAMQVARECAQIRREIGDRYGTARIVLLMAAEAYSIPDYEKAEIFNREVRDIWLSLKSWNFVAFVNVNLAYLAIFRDDFGAATALTDEALAIAREVNLRDHIAYALAMSGVLASLEGRFVDAWEMLVEAQSLAVHSSAIEALEWGLPLAACGLHDFESARPANLRALQFARRLNAPGRYFWHLPASCVLLAHEGRTARAAEILGLLFTHPASMPAWMERWEPLVQLRTDLETTLGTPAYEAALKRGETLDPQAVVTDVLAWLEGKSSGTPEPSGLAFGQQLTAREIEVLQLLAAGLTNPQIAQQLVIGSGTVKTHTLNIYRKLEVANRTQAIRRAQELGLLQA